MFMARKGFRWIKGDDVARSLYLPGKPVWRAIRREFGEPYLRAGRIDRKKLGALVFSSPSALRRLNGIVHPALVREIRQRLVKASKACVDMAVYFQAGAPKLGGRIFLVDAPLSLRVARLKRRGMDAARAKAQARALRFGTAERRRCDAVIMNAGTLSALHQKMATALNNFF